MNWASLGEGCPQIFDRIISLAAGGEQEAWDTNEWFMCVRKYGRVCNGWKRAILNSQLLFNVTFTDTLNDYSGGKKNRTIFYAPDSRAENALKKLIGEGYLQAAKTLDWTRPFQNDVDFVLSHAVGNKIEELRLYVTGPENVTRSLSGKNRCLNFSV